MTQIADLEMSPVFVSKIHKPANYLNIIIRNGKGAVARHDYDSGAMHNCTSEMGKLELGLAWAWAEESLTGLDYLFSIKQWQGNMLS